MYGFPLPTKLAVVIGPIQCVESDVKTQINKYNVTVNSPLLQKVDLYDCYWLCDKDGSHWLDFLECGIDEVAGGTCGVESRARCDE